MIISPATRPTPMEPPAIALAGTATIIQPHTSLAEFTTYRVGGKAEWYAAPRSLGDLGAVLTWFQSQNLPLTFLGAGSNLLISDQGIAGLVLSTRYLRQSKFDEEQGLITVAAGEPIAKVGWQAAKRGWQGLEWAVGIPGTVGGAVVMNAGAHNQCTAETLVEATVMHPDGGLEILSNEQLGFSYRTSNLQKHLGGCLVVDATFQLKPGFTREEIMARTTRNLHQRKSTQPYDKPNCGSVFRNPTPLYSARLIEELGLKGYRIGGAEVSQRHANFIVNIDNAKAQDVFNLIFHVQGEVEKHHGILLEPEVKMLGNFTR
ncbi:UDP-N-acetylmuramate dehydrogenase [Synechocystis salina LEGE 06155]|nr:UDP-N-acetylmuramate dehydrogenase [Synechocystis salina LEGE 06155]